MHWRQEFYVWSITLMIPSLQSSQFLIQITKFLEYLFCWFSWLFGAQFLSKYEAVQLAGSYFLQKNKCNALYDASKHSVLEKLSRNLVWSSFYIITTPHTTPCKYIILNAILLKENHMVFIFQTLVIWRVVRNGIC